MTKKAFENALRVIVILGGSTNAVLHLIAMANTVDVDLTLDDFQKMSDSQDSVMGPRFQILEGQKQDIFPVTFSPPRRGKMVPGSIESPV